MEEIIDALARSVKEAEENGNKTILFPVADAKILVDNYPTYGEIEEYFKSCARDLGYPEDGHLVEIAVVSVRAMFDGRFEEWKKKNK
jgi:hypothetical protein